MDEVALDAQVKEFQDRLEGKINDTLMSTSLSSIPILYHYTSAEGLAGVFNERKIWATHYQYVNDATEYIYANRLVKEVIEEKLPTASAMVRAILEAIQETPGGLLGLTEPYIACFCEDGDLLSQWRGYGAKGGGYAIGLQPGSNMQHMVGTPYRLIKVVYDRTRQRETVRFILDEFCKVIEAHSSPADVAKVKEPLVEAIFDERILTWQYNMPSPLDFFCQEVIHKLSAVATIMKDDRFSSENEWRLVHMQPKATKIAHADLRFRPAYGLLVPYIELHLFLKGDRAMSPPSLENFKLVSITHGPSLHPASAKRSLELLVASLKLGYDVGIKGSDIPVKL
jgi:hypothetical protein